MTLIRIKHIHSAFHPESGKYFCGDKCHQLRYFIHVVNYKAKIIFFLGSHGTFDEGLISLGISYCPVQMYNKDKPKKYTGHRLKPHLEFFCKFSF